MRVGVSRRGRMYVSMGPIGWLLVGWIYVFGYAAYYTLWAMVMLVRGLVWLIAWSVGRARSQKQLREWNAPEAVAARVAAQQDHDARTYRAQIVECNVDGLNGGSFVIQSAGWPRIRVEVVPEMAQRFLSLKNQDVVQVTVNSREYPSRVTEFFHLYRANGAVPRNAADFPQGLPQ